MRSLTKYVYIVLIFGSLNLWAEIYRFPVYPEPRDLKRPAKGLEEIPKVIRVLNPSMGNYFGTVAIEFEPDGKKFRRTQTYQIDFLQDAMRTLVFEKGCQALVSQQDAGQMLVDTMLVGTPHRRINIQALGEMKARRYLTQDQVDQEMASAEGANPNGFIFVESLSWLSSAQALDIFHGEIPWERIAEVDGPYGLSVEKIKERASYGDPNIKLRVRRATLRVALDQLFSYGALINQKLPFEKDLWKSGKLKFIPRYGKFRFEFGRASQIPGLVNEALEVTGIAAMAAAHHVLLDGDDGATMNTPNLATVYFHSKKPANTALYRDGLGARVVPGLEDPNDTMLSMSLQELMDRASKQIGYDWETFRGIRMVQEMRFYAFDWMTEGQSMTHAGPLLLKPSNNQFMENASKRADQSKPPEFFHRMNAMVFETLNQPILAPATVRNDDQLNHLPPEWQQLADYAVSGFNPLLAENDPLYLKKYMHTLKREFFLKGKKIVLATRCRAVAEQARAMNLNGYEYVSDDHGVRWAFCFSWAQLEEFVKKDPGYADRIQSRTRFSDARRNYALVNLDGLI